jgi:hypothetical protein
VILGFSGSHVPSLVILLHYRERFQSRYAAM